MPRGPGYLLRGCAKASGNTFGRRHDDPAQVFDARVIELVARHRTAQGSYGLPRRVADDGAGRENIVNVLFIRDRIAGAAHVPQVAHDFGDGCLGPCREPVEWLRTQQGHGFLVAARCEQRFAEGGRMQPGARTRSADDGDRAAALQRLEVDDGAVAQHAQKRIDLVALGHAPQLRQADGVQIAVRQVAPADLKGAIPDPVLLPPRSMLDIAVLRERLDQPLHDAGGQSQAARDLTYPQLLRGVSKQVEHRQRPRGRLAPRTRRFRYVPIIGTQFHFCMVRSIVLIVKVKLPVIGEEDKFQMFESGPPVAFAPTGGETMRRCLHAERMQLQPLDEAGGMEEAGG